MNDDARSMAKGIVFSIVANSGTGDGRVVKQAETLRDAGYDVWLHARLFGDVPPQEVFKGINVRRFDCFKDRFDNSLAARAEALEVFGRLAPQMREMAERRSASVPKPLADLIAEMTMEQKTRRKHSPKSTARKNPATAKRTIRRPLWKRVAKKILRLLGLDPTAVAARFRASVPPAVKVGAKVPPLKSVAKAMFTKAHAEHRKVLAETNFYFRYLQMAENLLEQDFEVAPDIIHAHDLLALPAAVALARRYDAKVIFDAHEIETERTPPLSSEKKRFIADLEEELFAATDDMIVCCDSAAEFYLAVFKKRRPTLVMNAPDDRYLSNRAPAGSDVRSLSGLNPDTPLVAYTGSVGLEARGVDQIVRAIALLPGYHLAVQGPRNPKFDNWLKTVTDAEGVTDRVHLIPPAPQEVLIDSLRTADVGVCAFQDVSLNHRYALPNKIFEMAFAGLPLCLANLVEMRKFVQQLGNGELMDETNPKDIARAIRQVAENRQKYELSGAQRSLLEAEYSWSKQAERLLALYQRTLQRRPPTMQSEPAYEAANAASS